MRTVRLTALLLLLATACSDTTAPPPSTPAKGAVAGQGAARVVLMPQNLFVGAAVDAVLLALGTSDPEADLPALLTAIQQLARTHFPTRAAALAEQIGRYRPHAVGLQEVSVIQIV